ncbi:MarR family transcriptional regulator [Microbacterium pumilum]
MVVDVVDAMRDEWGAILPGVDTSPLDIFGRLRRIYVLLQTESDRVLAVHDISRADFDIVSTLQRHQRSLTPTEIATTTLTSAAGTTKRLHRLVKIGLVTREPNPGDGRGSLISLTQRGVDIIPPILEGLSSLEHTLLAGMSAAQQRQATSALRFILGKLDDAADPPSSGPSALLNAS